MSLKPRKKRVLARRVTGLSGAPKTPGRAADFYFQYEVENKQIIELVKSWIRIEFLYSKTTRLEIYVSTLGMYYSHKRFLSYGLSSK
jgi:hypothetical protein